MWDELLDPQLDPRQAGWHPLELDLRLDPRATADAGLNGAVSAGHDASFYVLATFAKATFLGPSSFQFVRLDVVTDGAVLANVINIAVCGIVRRDFLARH